MTATLIVTVDTEEEGRWTGIYRRSGNPVENIPHLAQFQSLCNSYGIAPTYLIDAPVADDDRSVEILRGLQDKQRCEVGTHMHPWCNPPFNEDITPRNTYFCNLPESLQRAKLAWLTERIEDRIGRRPTLVAYLFAAVTEDRTSAVRAWGFGVVARLTDRVGPRAT